MSVVLATRDVNRSPREPPAHRIAHRVISAWRTPRQRRLGLAVVAAGLAALGFARVAEDYLTNDPLARWDVSFARWLAGGRSVAATDLFRAITFLGSPATVLAIATIVVVLLYRRRKLSEAALLPIVLGGSQLLNLVLKLSFHRARPEYAFVNLDTYSFPSGHAMTATAAYGAFAYLLWGHLRSGGTRLLVSGVAALLVGLICFSRLYLGVHYLSDVLAGIAGGAFWLATSIALRTLYSDAFVGRFTNSRLDRLARRVTRS